MAKKKLLVKGYSDSDWASNKKSLKSIFFFIYMLNKRQMSWYLRKQARVVLLLTKAKYIVLTLIV